MESRFELTSSSTITGAGSTVREGKKKKERKGKGKKNSGEIDFLHIRYAVKPNTGKQANDRLKAK